MTQAPLLVGLDGKMARVSAHWAAVDEALPPKCPLLLLSGVDEEAFDGLRERLPELRGRVAARDARKMNAQDQLVALHETHGLSGESLQAWCRARGRKCSCCRSFGGGRASGA